MCLSKIRGGIIIMINRVCSYRGPNTEYENDDEPLVIDIL